MLFHITNINTLNDNDVIMGKGRKKDPGNDTFKKLVDNLLNDFTSAPIGQKSVYADFVVKSVRSADPPGRFLLKEADGTYYDIGDDNARDKAYGRFNAAAKVNKDRNKLSQPQPQQKSYSELRDEVGKNKYYQPCLPKPFPPPEQSSFDIDFFEVGDEHKLNRRAKVTKDSRKRYKKTHAGKTQKKPLLPPRLDDEDPRNPESTCFTTHLLTMLPRRRRLWRWKKRRRRTKITFQTPP